MKEKRSYPRINAAVEVRDCANFRTWWTRNLSLGGCFIERRDELDSLSIASWLTLKFEIPGVDEVVLASGMVRHTGKHREGVGINLHQLIKSLLTI